MRCPAGLAAATEQLPVVGDSKAQSEAQMLLDACQAAQADTWALPLALILEDVNCLAGASTHPLTAATRAGACPAATLINIIGSQVTAGVGQVKTVGAVFAADAESHSLRLV